MNSEHGHTALKDPDLGEEQVKFVEKILRKNPNVDWTMIFMHQPLWLRGSGKNWLKVENLLKDRKHSVFTGHHHKYKLYNRNKSDYFVLATMGGGSKLRGNEFGEFDHFVEEHYIPLHYTQILKLGLLGQKRHHRLRNLYT